MNDASRAQRLVRSAKDVALRALATGTPVEPVPGSLVVAVLGQSNAQGAGREADGASPPPTDPRVHQWAASGRYAGRTLLAVDPLIHPTSGRGVGFGVAFGTLLAASSGRTVLLVPIARGDTSFDPKNGFTWDPADTTTRTNLFRTACRRIPEAVAAAPGNELAAVLWHQGESDVPRLAADDYAARLDDLVCRLRAHVGADVPFLVGQMVPEEIESDAGYAAIDAVHASLPLRHRRAAFVPGPRDAFNPDEHIHYSPAGQRELARGFHAAYLALVAAD